MRALAIVAAIVCAPHVAHAKPTTKHSKHGVVTQFNGDRPAPQMAQHGAAGDVLQSVRERRKTRAGKKRQRWVPVPRPRPGYVTPMVIGGRPAGCPARAWCGCWLAHHFGISDRSLWLARNWTRIGRPASAQPGAIVVFARGRGGHVGKVTDVAPGRIKVLSGNDGRMVRERWRPARGVLAYRML